MTVHLKEKDQRIIQDARETSTNMVCKCPLKRSGLSLHGGVDSLHITRRSLFEPSFLVSGRELGE